MEKRKVKSVFVLLAAMMCLFSCGTKTSRSEGFKSQSNSSSPDVSVSASEVSYSSEEAETSSGLEFVINELTKTCYVKGRGTCIDKNIVIPRTFNGFTVSGIGESAFESDSLLTSVVLPDSVNYIQKKAFSQCIELINVDLGHGLQEIGDEVFYWCHSLSKLKIPESVERIGQLAFFDSGFPLENGLMYVDNWLVQGNKAKGSIATRTTTVGLADKVFNNNSQINEVILNTGIRHYGSNPFSYCSNLEKISIAKGKDPGAYVTVNFSLDDKDVVYDFYFRNLS